MIFTIRMKIIAKFALTSKKVISRMHLQVYTYVCISAYIHIYTLYLSANVLICIISINKKLCVDVHLYKEYLLTSPNAYFELITVKIFHIIEEVFIEIMGNNRFQNHFEFD